MAGTKFSIADDAVVKHASNLETSEASMNAQASAFLQAIEPLTADWKGSSFDSWAQLTESWSSAMKDLNAALKEIKDNVGNAGNLYNQYESQQTEALKSVSAGASWDAAKFRK